MGEVWVTGATGGIGSAIVSALATAGHQVTAIGRDEQRLQALPAARTIAADLARPEHLRDEIPLPQRLDAVVHTAGVSLAAIAPVADTSVQVWHETLSVNAVAAAEVSRLVLPALRRSRGHVVFVNSAPGVRAVPGWSAFAASKAALQELADSMRQEEHAAGVRVTTVYPAGTATEHLRLVREGFGGTYDPRRLIRPESLAAMVVWVLAAPADAYVSELSVMASPREG